MQEKNHGQMRLGMFVTATFLGQKKEVRAVVPASAVLRSVSASVHGSRSTATMPAAVPGPVAAIAHQSIGAAYVAAGKIAALGHPALGQALHHTSTNAFLDGLTIGALVAGGVAAVGAVLAARFLPAQPTRPAGPASETAGDTHETEPQTLPARADTVAT